MSHVFISYSREDSLFAQTLAKMLKKKGHKVWRDTERIKAGDQWREEIDDAIYAAYVMVLVLSPDSHKSPYVTYEWSFAHGIGIPIIPVVSRQGDLHPRLLTYQTIDFSRQGNPDWTRLINDLDNKIDQVPSQVLKDFYEFRNSLQERGEILNSTGKQTFYQYIGGLITHDRGFRLKDEDWALQCNSAFWQSLSSYQGKKRGKNESIQAFVTHTASPDIWLSDDATDSLSQQKAFFDAGGKIVRVFIGPFASPRGGDAKYEKAMSKMSNRYKVHSFYVQKPKGDNTLDDYTWIPSLCILQTWRSRIRFGDNIQEVDLSEADETLRNDQIKYWKKLKSLATDLKGRKLGSYPEYKL